MSQSDMESIEKVFFHAWGAIGTLASMCFVVFSDDLSTRLYAAVAIAVLWTCFRFTKSAASVNLIGSKYYGGSEVAGGSITTKWIVFFTIPLLPVRSYFIPGGDKNSADGGFFPTESNVSFTAIPLKGVGIYWRQLPLVYAKTLLFWLVLFAVLFVLDHLGIL